MSEVERLLEISSASIEPAPGEGAVQLPAYAQDLGDLLAARNGLYAFEGALHARAWQGNESEPGIVDWNKRPGWKDAYGDLDDIWFFAEDAFGRQYGRRHDGVVRFEPETGECGVIGADVEEWAGAILRDYEWLTGWPLAHDWQGRNGPLRCGSRLLPIIPFILGGQYDVENLMEYDATEGMRIRGDLWRQIHHLPAGTIVIPTFRDGGYRV